MAPQNRKAHRETDEVTPVPAKKHPFMPKDHRSKSEEALTGANPRGRQKAHKSMPEMTEANAKKVAEGKAKTEAKRKVERSLRTERPERPEQTHEALIEEIKGLKKPTPIIKKALAKYNVPEEVVIRDFHKHFPELGPGATGDHLMKMYADKYEEISDEPVEPFHIPNQEPVEFVLPSKEDQCPDCPGLEVCDHKKKLDKGLVKDCSACPSAAKCIPHPELGTFDPNDIIGALVPQEEVKPEPVKKKTVAKKKTATKPKTPKKK